MKIDFSQKLIFLRISKYLSFSPDYPWKCPGRTYLLRAMSFQGKKCAKIQIGTISNRILNRSILKWSPCTKPFGKLSKILTRMSLIDVHARLFIFKGQNVPKLIFFHFKNPFSKGFYGTLCCILAIYDHSSNTKPNHGLLFWVFE